MGRLGVGVRVCLPLLWALAAGPLHAQASLAPPNPPAVRLVTFDYGLKARALADGVYGVEGAVDDFSLANGCNIINTGFVTTGAGVLVINTGPSRRYGEQLRALIARTTTEPVVQVIHLNLHPDYFLGNQAFADVPITATADTRTGMKREAKGYEDNMYRLCGDWMKGTEARLPTQSIGPGPLRIGQREFELREFNGHTRSDLVLIVKSSGKGSVKAHDVAFVGGLVFADRVPTTPHADLPAWLQSLQSLEGLALHPLATWCPAMARCMWACGACNKPGLTCNGSTAVSVIGRWRAGRLMRCCAPHRPSPLRVGRPGLPSTCATWRTCTLAMSAQRWRPASRPDP